MVNSRNINDTDTLARFIKALGDTNRLGIVMSVGKEPRSVTELVRTTGLSQTLVSFHLRIMREADIVRTERKGPFIYYSLSDPSLLDILADLSQLNDKKPNKKGKPEPVLKKMWKVEGQIKRTPIMRKPKDNIHRNTERRRSR